MSGKREKMEARKFSENPIEREKEPKKVIILLRHPEQEYKFRSPVRSASKEGVDLETYFPVSKKGLGSVRRLVDHIKNEFPWEVDDNEYAIYSSPIKRALTEAEILEKNIRLARADNAEIPVPANIENKILDGFTEVTFTNDINYDNRITKTAREKGKHVLEVWLEEEGENLLPRFQKKLEDIRKEIDFLIEQPTKVDIVVSHRLAISVAIWAGKNHEKFSNRQYKLNLDDLKEIFSYNWQLPYTSMTEINVFDNKIGIGEIGFAPHLKKNEEK